MRTKLVGVVGVIAGAALVWLTAQSRVPAGEGDSQASYYLLIAGVSVWIITALAAFLSHDPSSQRLRAAVAAVVGVVVTAGILGLAVDVAKTPGLTTYCVRDGVKPHRLVCNNQIRDFATSDDQAFLIVGLAVLVAMGATLAFVWLLSRDREQPTLAGAA